MTKQLEYLTNKHNKTIQNINNTLNTEMYTSRLRTGWTIQQT